MPCSDRDLEGCHAPPALPCHAQIETLKAAMASEYALQLFKGPAGLALSPSSALVTLPLIPKPAQLLLIKCPPSTNAVRPAPRAPNRPQPCKTSTLTLTFNSQLTLTLPSAPEQRSATLNLLLEHLAEVSPLS